MCSLLSFFQTNPLGYNLFDKQRFLSTLSISFQQMHYIKERLIKFLTLVNKQNTSQKLSLPNLQIVSTTCIFLLPDLTLDDIII